MWQDLPKADLYICTGDMLPNSLGHTKNWLYEEEFQRKFIKDNPIKLPAGSHVYCVRGNHDHVPIGGLFPGCKVTEFNDDMLVGDHNYVGFDVAGIRGVRRIFGNGPDEMPSVDLENKINFFASRRKWEHKTLLISHCPPYQVMDHSPQAGKGDNDGNCGSRALLKLSRHGKIAAHFFGHIHERKGIRKIDGTYYSNAATGVNILDLIPNA